MTVLREPLGPIERLRPLAQALAALPGGVLVGVVQEPAGVILATAADTGIDAGRALKSALERHGGRGGGNARLAQGTVKDAAALDGVVATLWRLPSC